jgi:uncharacterized SAM-binding protein YcdF (DUF218 family)
MRSADAIVVLGCPHGAALTRRVERAIQLFHDGAAPVLVLCGGGREGEYTRSIAIKNGVPGEALLHDTRSFDTLENAHETASLLAPKNLRSVLLVSDRAHLPRAWLLFRSIGLEVAGCTGAMPPPIGEEVRIIIYEIASLPVSLLPYSVRRALTKFKTAVWIKVVTRGR